MFSFLKKTITSILCKIRKFFSIATLRNVFLWIKNLTLIKFIKILIITFLSGFALLSLGLFLLIHYPATQIPEYEPIDETVYLDQGWGLSSKSEQRQLYYYTPQGTNLKGLEYEWFVNLEMPWGQEKFANHQHMQAYGFIVDDQPSKHNPDRLPVGFSQHYSASTNANYLDITCAACHNGQLNITQNGKRYAVRIDGGQAMHAFTTMNVGHFIPSMLAAMASTYINPFKFNRFADDVLGQNHTNEAKSALKERFGQVLINFLKQGYNDMSKHLYPVEEGFGRTDALARIGNTVFGDNLSDENYHVATGPVSYPPVWNIWKFDWVQYGASVKQPMARNMGEALGVGAHINFMNPYGEPLKPEQRFNSGVLVENIYDIETTLQALTPPPWPEKLFGEIDHQKAAKGKVLFKQHCQGCHGPFPADETLKHIDMPLKTENEPVWVVKTLSIEEIGTDPNTAYNFVSNRFNLNKTGLTDEDIVNTVRPIHIKQLKRVVEVSLASTQLVDFLSGDTPNPANLTYQTDWVLNNAKIIDELNYLFSTWQGSYNNISTLAEKIKQFGDEAIQSDIKTAIVKTQLEQLDSVLDNLKIEALTVGEALNLIGIMIREKHYQDKNYTADQQACFDGFAALDLPQQPLAYKARPLAGIWATPPFLHNGSVPNIYQLLSPVFERDSKFFVGRREFDPSVLGYDTTPMSQSGFWFDTSISGNTNVGHEFRAGYVKYKPGNPPQYGVIGPELTPDERWQLIEYLKIHQDNPPSKATQPQNCKAL